MTDPEAAADRPLAEGGSASAAAKPGRLRPLRLWRALSMWVLADLLLVVGILAAVAWLVSTEPGLRAIADIVRRLAPITIDARGAQGALTRDFGFEQLRVVAGSTEVEISGLRARFGRIGASPLRLDFDSLSARRVEVKVTPSGESTGPPDSIASPVAVSARRLAVGELALHIGNTAINASAIDAEAAIGPEGYRIGSGQLRYAGQPLTVDGQLSGRRPFAVALHGSVRTELQEREVQASWRAEGSLVDLTLSADVSGGGASGNAVAQIASFASPALTSVQAALEGIDLHAWQARLPITRLGLRADLRPDAAGTGLEGSVRAVNHDPGTIDRQRIPVREASAEVALTRDTLRASRLAVALTRGQVSGSASAQFGATPQSQADLRLDGVDPAAIHSKAQPLRIDGRARLEQRGPSVAVQADLRNRGAKVVNARVDFKADTERIDLARAELTLGRGRLRSSGTIGLTGERRVRLEGKIERFEPGLLVQGIDAVISGSFGIDARLSPKPAGSLRFALEDGRAFGRPLAGHGKLQLDAARRLDVDLQLAVRSARLSAKGGLGSPGQSLAIALDVPALDELLPALHGGVKVDATAHGAWNAPAVDARVDATNLRAFDQSVALLDLSASYGGGTDGRIALRAQASGHRWGKNDSLSLRSATLAIDGTLAAHAITLQATTDKARRIALAAQGGWAEPRWRGQLREASLSGPLDLKLLEPAALSVGADGVDFGPARIGAVGAHFDAVRFARDANGLRSSGSFSGLKPQELFADAIGTVGAVPPSVTPMTLQGRWQLDLGTQANGTLSIERSGGDLYAGAPVDTPLLIRDLRLDATLVANALSAHAVASSERGGTAEAKLTALVEHDPVAGWRLAQHRPWQLDASANLPSLARLNALLGERLGTDLRIDGRLAAKLAIGGTPAQIQANGTLSGDGLRLAWIEQGMRLDDGRLRAHLDGDRVVLDELRFTSTPHVRPKDPRVATKVRLEREGSVSASGELKLRDAQGTIRVDASHLPLLQRPDRWVVASGNATIQASLQRAQIDGDFTADAGYVEATRTGLPSLSSDVVIVRPGTETAARGPRFALGFDLGIDLGPAFYVKGAGLDARVEGKLRLRSPGRGAVTATGTIEAKEGRYEGFGQRLTIKRARLNFQGAPDNPSLDVLAVREGLPVEVGVTVTRTVASPLVRLYSDPPMADPEVMSWLIYGHAGDQTRADNLALLQAAAAAISGNEEGIAGKFAQSLGIDEVTLRSGDFRSAGSLLPQSSVAGDLRADRTNTSSASTEILSIGKRINEAITISYEQAIAGTESVVQLTYRLTQRLYLVARAGTENAFDLVYSWTFD
jgi:translocation and assembly module TamB